MLEIWVLEKLKSRQLLVMEEVVFVQRPLFCDDCLYLHSMENSCWFQVQDAHNLHLNLLHSFALIMAKFISHCSTFFHQPFQFIKWVSNDPIAKNGKLAGAYYNQQALFWARLLAASNCLTEDVEYHVAWFSSPQISYSMSGAAMVIGCPTSCGKPDVNQYYHATRSHPLRPTSIMILAVPIYPTTSWQYPTIRFAPLCLLEFPLRLCTPSPHHASISSWRTAWVH